MTCLGTLIVYNLLCNSPHIEADILSSQLGNAGVDVGIFQGGGDFDQRDVGVGSSVYLPVMVPQALVFMADPHAVISDGIISGTGVECTTQVRARITLLKDHKIDRPIIEHADTIQILGVGPTVEAATEDASRGAVDFLAANTGLSRQEAYMLLGIVGDLRVGTSPRPIMAARLIVPRQTLADAR